MNSHHKKILQYDIDYFFVNDSQLYKKWDIAISFKINDKLLSFSVREIAKDYIAIIVHEPYKYSIPKNKTLLVDKRSIIITLYKKEKYKLYNNIDRLINHTQKTELGSELLKEFSIEKLKEIYTDLLKFVIVVKYGI